MNHATNAIKPTYFLYSGWLFHEEALPALASARVRAESSTPPPGDDAPATPQPRRGEDPGPEGPEGEPVGEDEETPGEDGRDVESKSSPGPGVPMVPEHGTPDANPIDPRVF
ncbi:MAG: hypothetical protein KIS78_22535 [Labilithrix sp.]|nr:hypothetical protein [Labilithrix sp.]